MSEYHIKRTDKAITDNNKLMSVLKSGKYAMLSLCRDNEPYIVTMNYGCDEKNRSLYFHAALEGLKLDFIEYNSQVCGTVIEDLGYKYGECNHAYRSVVFRGTITVLNDISQKKKGMDIMLNHLEKSPEDIKKKFLKDDNAFSKVTILRLAREEINGKEGY